MEIKKYLKPYIECTKVETECALLTITGGGNNGGFNHGNPGGGGGHHAKTNPFDYEDDQDENENEEN